MKLKDGYRSPEWVLDLVRKCSDDGSIFLDPCTNEDNNTKATHYYTSKNPTPNPWDCPYKPGGLVYQNHPYSDNLTWARHALDYVRLRRDCEYIVLANASAGTRWYGLLTDNCDALATLNKRLAFRDYKPPHDPVAGNQWGTALWYFGKNRQRFARVFRNSASITAPLIV